jgi:NADH-quinone oxidoreductase subunit H
MDVVDILIDLGKAVFVFALLLILTLFVIWAERKVLAHMQSRIGPNRAGPFGILQSIADGVKLFMKEDILPISADKLIYPIAPVVSALPAFLAFSVVPFGDRISIAGHKTFLQLADLNVGLLFFLAMGSVSVYGIALAGWSSGSKYPLFGAVRSSAQMISYEIAMGLSVIPVVLYSGTLSTRGIVEAQRHGWFVLVLLPSFVIFLMAGIAETNRAPFDLPEAETELVAGYHTEYAGVKFALFFLAEYIHVVTISSIAVTLFWGGWNGPGFAAARFVWPVLWYVVKTAAFVLFFFWLRASLPRLRYDQLMNIGWKFLIPIAMVWIPLAAAARVVEARRWIFVAIGVVVALFVLSLFVPSKPDAEALLAEEKVHERA